MTAEARAKEGFENAVARLGEIATELRTEGCESEARSLEDLLKDADAFTRAEAGW